MSGGDIGGGSGVGGVRGADRRTPLVAAHTGCGEAPDNTWASYLEGIALGADIVEVDVLGCRDGTLVLQHDESMYLELYDYEQLNLPVIRAKLAPYHLEHEIVRLEEVLRHSADQQVMLNLDLKSDGCIGPTVELVRLFGGEARVFTTGCSEGLPARYPDIRALLNTPVQIPPGTEEASFAAAVCEQAARLGYCGINMNHSTCRELVVELAHSMGLLVWVYTVNEPEEMKRLSALGVDAITTRKPALLRRFIAGMR